MTHQKAAAILGCLMLTAAVLPLTTAHLTSPSTTSGLATGDDCRWEGAASTCSGSGGVSGTYVSGTGTFLTGGDAFPLAVGGVGTIFAPGYAATTFALCDLEGGDGTRNALGEERVDDDPNDPPGEVDDGTWDDGGLGGACHTDGWYDIDAWNTPGCGTGGTHAVAEDAVSGGDVWISATCDQRTGGGSSPSLLSCLINNPVGDPPHDCLWILQPDEDLVDVALFDPYGDGFTFPGYSCGSDGITDTINDGPGGGSGSAHGVPYPADPLCPSTAGAAAVFVHDYVTLGGNPHHPTGGDPAVVPATAGWIDSRDLSSYGPAAFGPGRSVPGPTACSDLADNDGDGRTDASDPSCQAQVAGIPVYDPLDGNE